MTWLQTRWAMWHCLKLTIHIISPNLSINIHIRIGWACYCQKLLAKLWSIQHAQFIFPPIQQPMLRENWSAVCVRGCFLQKYCHSHSCLTLQLIHLELNGDELQYQIQPMDESGAISGKVHPCIYLLFVNWNALKTALFSPRLHQYVGLL